MRAALVSNGVVENVIVYDPENHYVPADGLTLIVLEEDAVAGIGWTYSGNAFAPPPEA